MEDIRGKTAIVTGSNAGIGREVARGLALRGCRVVLACRNAQAAGEAADEIRREAPEAKVEVGPSLDLASHRSIRAFVEDYGNQPLHLLVNNAGANFLPKWYTEDGIPGLVQVNYLGPYLLTRLLASRLVASAPSRVVNVSSVMHRWGSISRPLAFLQDWEAGSYSNTKLANVLFANEFHWRMASTGVQSCAVDPGGVRTGIYRFSVYGRLPFRWILELGLAPPSDGAQAVLHAATCKWSEKEEKGVSPTQVAKNKRIRKVCHKEQTSDCRFYARGLFALPTVTGFHHKGDNIFGKLWSGLGQSVQLIHALLDYRMRLWSRGRWLSKTRAAPAAPSSYDRGLARRLWEESARLTGLPSN